VHQTRQLIIIRYGTQPAGIEGVTQDMIVGMGYKTVPKHDECVRHVSWKMCLWCVRHCHCAFTSPPQRSIIPRTYCQQYWHCLLLTLSRMLYGSLSHALL
jgi:hypothetical protein